MAQPDSNVQDGSPSAAPANPQVGSDVQATRVLVDTPVEQLAVQKDPSGPTNPQVDDSIQNEQTNDEVIANLPTHKNEQGTEQVIYEADGSIRGLAAEDHPFAVAGSDASSTDQASAPAQETTSAPASNSTVVSGAQDGQSEAPSAPAADNSEQSGTTEG